MPPGPRGRPAGGLQFSIEGTPVMRLSRTSDNRAWAKGIYGAIYRGNLRIAREAQDRALAELEASIVRPEQETGRLERALSSPQAVYADALRFGIGDTRFLDREVRYWRAIEYGMTTLVGREFRGMWTNAPKFTGGRVGLVYPQRGVRTGRPIIFPFTFARKWTIERPIEPHLFLTNAWNSIKADRVRAIYRDELSQVVGPKGQRLQLGTIFRSRYGRSLGDADLGF